MENNTLPVDKVELLKLCAQQRDKLRGYETMVNTGELIHLNNLMEALRCSPIGEFNVDDFKAFIAYVNQFAINKVTGEK